MPQEIRVLCCFKCKIYQVDIVKKTNKWQCKLCSEKQSVFKEYFRGTGPECRRKVQQLNLNSNVTNYKKESELLDLLENNDLELDFNLVDKEAQYHKDQVKSAESKWTKYVEDSKELRPLQHTDIQVKDTKRKNKSSSYNSTNIKYFKNNLGTKSKWDAYL